LFSFQADERRETRDEFNFEKQRNTFKLKD
jgi:hypothetical protein